MFFVLFILTVLGCLAIASLVDHSTYLDFVDGIGICAAFVLVVIIGYTFGNTTLNDVVLWCLIATVLLGCAAIASYATHSTGMDYRDGAGICAAFLMVLAITVGLGYANHGDPTVKAHTVAAKQQTQKSPTPAPTASATSASPAVTAPATPVPTVNQTDVNKAAVQGWVDGNYPTPYYTSSITNNNGNLFVVKVMYAKDALDPHAGICSKVVTLQVNNGRAKPIGAPQFRGTYGAGCSKIK